MSWELWFALVLASTAMLAIPGPTVMLVVSYALGRGNHTGWATVPGVTLGDFTAMTISLLGAGAVLAASATLFTILKLVGAAYLIWLGIGLWRAKPKLAEAAEETSKGTGWSMFWNAYVVTALNPKGIVFFVAFVPQFVDPSKSAVLQFAVLEITFLALAAINVAIWAALAGQLRETFTRPSTLATVNKVGGSFLIGAGVLTAAVRQGD